MARTPRSIRRSRHLRDVRPAMRGGINATPLVLPAGDWSTMGEWVLSRFGAEGLKALDGGDFLYDHSREISQDDPYVTCERIWIFRPVPDEPDEPIVFDVVAQNDRYIVVDKPHDMATIPRGSHVAKTVTVAVRRQFGNDSLVTAHRLDAETAGLVLITTALEYRGPYQLLFENRRVSKRYQAVAPYVAGFDDWQRVELRLERGRVPLVTDVVDGEPNAVTDLKVARVLDRSDGDGRPLALWDLAPLTGKTHQLRVTLAHIGAPIVGDPLYPRLLSHEEMEEREYPLQLLARELAFTDPIDGTECTFVSRRELEAGK